jgi:hypothetical protein
MGFVMDKDMERKFALALLDLASVMGEAALHRVAARLGVDHPINMSSMTSEGILSWTPEVGAVAIIPEALRA